MKTIVVTGGAGFIGSAVCRRIIRETPHRVVNLDLLTYAGNLESLTEIVNDRRYSFVRADIRDASAVRDVLERERPAAIMHLAAESHVDRSIDGPRDFVETNIVGTFTLLEEARRYWMSLAEEERGDFRFLHVSTDEVFGSLGDKGLFSESTPYQPNSPYSASKASSDHLVRAWHHTFGLPVLTTNCSNNYGPYQFPEKLIPLVTLNALEGRELPVYGRGDNVRDWLHVEDHAEALLTVLGEGEVGESYCVGGKNEMKNIDVVRMLCRIVDELSPSEEIGPRESLICFVHDRPGHDQRYAIDTSKIEAELGWAPRETFESGLRATVEWYLTNRRWWKRVRSGEYRGERLGLSAQVGA